MITLKMCYAIDCVSICRASVVSNAKTVLWNAEEANCRIGNLFLVGQKECRRVPVSKDITSALGSYRRLASSTHALEDMRSCMT